MSWYEQKLSELGELLGEKYQQQEAIIDDEPWVLIMPVRPADGISPDTQWVLSNLLETCLALDPCLAGIAVHPRGMDTCERKLTELGEAFGEDYELGNAVIDNESWVLIVPVSPADRVLPDTLWLLPSLLEAVLRVDSCLAGIVIHPRAVEIVTVELHRLSEIDQSL